MIDLDKEEKEYIKSFLGACDPFSTVENAEDELRISLKHLEEATKKAKECQERLLTLQQRDEMVIRLKKKLSD